MIERVYLVSNTGLEPDKTEHEPMSIPSKDLKSTKKRIRVWRNFARITRTAFVTLTVACFLIGIGYAVLFICAVSALPSRWGDGGPPQPPATPSLKIARLDCINDIETMIGRKAFTVHRPGDPLHPVHYHYQDCDITILQEYDCNPNYVFYGRIQLSKPCIYGTVAQELTVRNDPDIPSSWETDFFLVNRFNPSEALHYGGRDNMYFPEHYDRIQVNFGFEHTPPGHE